MSYKIKLSKSVIQRLNNYINSDYCSVDDVHLTEHWDNWTKKKQITAEDDYVLIEKTNDKTTIQQGFDTDYLSNFTEKPSYKISLKEILLNGLSQLRKKNQPIQSMKNYLKKNKCKSIVLPNKFQSRSHILSYLHFNNIINTDKLNELGDIKYLEIGSGSGLLTSLIVEKLNPKKVYLIDLPHVIIYSFIYLSYRFPNLKISLPNEINLRESSLVSFYLPGKFENIRNFNLMVNTESFAEMSMSSISNYMKFLRENSEIKNLFYCCNRVEKYMRNKGQKNENLLPIRFTEYPWMQQDEVFLYKVEGFYSRFTKVPFFSKAVRLHNIV